MEALDGWQPLVWQQALEEFCIMHSVIFILVQVFNMWVLVFDLPMQKRILIIIETNTNQNSRVATS